MRIMFNLTAKESFYRVSLFHNPVDPAFEKNSNGYTKTKLHSVVGNVNYLKGRAGPVRV